VADWEAVGLSAFDALVYRQLLRDPGVPVGHHGEALEVPLTTVDAAVSCEPNPAG
jgi:hypothetical protein